MEIEGQGVTRLGGADRVKTKSVLGYGQGAFSMASIFKSAIACVFGGAYTRLGGSTRKTGLPARQCICKAHIELGVGPPLRAGGSSFCLHPQYMRKM